jgi:hypothetical protein
MRVAVATPAPVDAVTSSQSELSCGAGTSREAFMCPGSRMRLLLSVVQLRSYYRNSKIIPLYGWHFRPCIVFLLSPLAVSEHSIAKTVLQRYCLLRRQKCPGTYTEWVKQRLSCMTAIARIRGSRRPLSTQKPLLAPAGSPSRRKSPLQRGLWCHLIFILSTCAERTLSFAK